MVSVLHQFFFEVPILYYMYCKINLFFWKERKLKPTTSDEAKEIEFVICYLLSTFTLWAVTSKLNSMELGKVSRKLQNISIEFETFKTKDDEPKISNVIFDWGNTEIAKNISQIWYLFQKNYYTLMRRIYCNFT